MVRDGGRPPSPIKGEQSKSETTTSEKRHRSEKLDGSITKVGGASAAAGGGAAEEQQPKGPRQRTSGPEKLDGSKTKVDGALAMAAPHTAPASRQSLQEGTAQLHRSHNLDYRQGFFMCLSCAAYGSIAHRKLCLQCPRFLTTKGKETLQRWRGGAAEKQQPEGPRQRMSGPEPPRKRPRAQGRRRRR